MTELAKQSCEACRGDAPQLTDPEIETLKSQLSDWQVTAVEGEKRFVRSYRFPNFIAALDFAVKVGHLAEEHNHHPKLCVEWGGVEVSWWTHKIKGLHHNDAVMAAKTDALYG